MSPPHLIFMSTDDESVNSGVTVQVQGHDALAVPDSSSLLTTINYPTKFLVTILTLGIPAFYASVTTRVTSSTLGEDCIHEAYIMLMCNDY